MKLVTFTDGTAPRAGALVGDRILDLQKALPGASFLARGVLGVVEGGEQALAAIADATSRAESIPDGHFVPYRGASLLAPIPRPTSMRDGYAFRQHVEAARRNRGVPMIPEYDRFPVFYFTNHQAVVGPGELRVRPMQRDKLDFELELAIVVGKEGRDIAAKDADAYIHSFMIMNDWSARAVQMEEMKLSLGPAKGKDFATGLGPILVTKDELADRRIPTPRGDRYDLEMTCAVNEIILSRGNARDMTWTFAEILERVSYGVTVYPGDVIGSGTVGTGCLLELNGSKITDDQWLQAGDRVVCEIERLGRLENTIAFTD